MVAGFIRKSDIPLEIRQKIGDSNSNIISFLVNDLVANSSENSIAVSDEAHELMLKLRKFNYQHIYNHPLLVQIQQSCEKVMSTLFDYLFDLFLHLDYETGKYKGKRTLVLDNYFVDYLKNMRPFYLKELEENQWSLEDMGKQIVADYLSGMTDRYALECMHEISIPRPLHFRHGKGTF